MKVDRIEEKDSTQRARRAQRGNRNKSRVRSRTRDLRPLEMEGGRSISLWPSVFLCALCVALFEIRHKANKQSREDRRRRDKTAVTREEVQCDGR